MNGLWRDGKLLVIQLDTADFTGRCPWTNEEVGKKTTSIPVFGPRPAGWSASLIGGIRHGAKREKLVLSLPASQGWLDRRASAKRRFGYVVALLGIASLVAGGVIHLVLNAYYPAVFERPHPNAFTVSVFLMVLGPLAVGAGLVWPKIEGAPGPGGYVKAELIDDPHIWVHGADPKFLELLPAWTGAPLKNRKLAGPSFSDMLATGWPILVILALCAIVAATLMLGR